MLSSSLKDESYEEVSLESQVISFNNIEDDITNRTTSLKIFFFVLPAINRASFVRSIPSSKWTELIVTF